MVSCKSRGQARSAAEIDNKRDGEEADPIDDYDELLRTSPCSAFITSFCTLVSFLLILPLTREVLRLTSFPGLFVYDDVLSTCFQQFPAVSVPNGSDPPSFASLCEVLMFRANVVDLSTRRVLLALVCIFLRDPVVDVNVEYTSHF